MLFIRTLVRRTPTPSYMQSHFSDGNDKCEQSIKEYIRQQHLQNRAYSATHPNYTTVHLIWREIVIFQQRNITHCYS